MNRPTVVLAVYISWTLFLRTLAVQPGIHGHFAPLPSGLCPTFSRRDLSIHRWTPFAKEKLVLFDLAVSASFLLFSAVPSEEWVAVCLSDHPSRRGRKSYHKRPCLPLMKRKFVSTVAHFEPMTSHWRAWMRVGCFKIIHSSFHCLFRVTGIPMRSWILACLNTWSRRKRWAAIHWFLFVFKSRSGLLLPPAFVLKTYVPPSQPLSVTGSSVVIALSPKKKIKKSTKTKQVVLVCDHETKIKGRISSSLNNLEARWLPASCRQLQCTPVQLAFETDSF